VSASRKRGWYVPGTTSLLRQKVNLVNCPEGRINSLTPLERRRKRVLGGRVGKEDKRRLIAQGEKEKNQLRILYSKEWKGKVEKRRGEGNK